MNKLIAKLAQKVGIAWITARIRDAAEGKLGERWHALYWVLAGQKRLISLLFGLAGVTLIYAGASTGGATLTAIGGVGIGVGILDNDWRSEKPVWLESTRWWRFLADNSANFVTVGAMLSAAFATCSQQTADVLLRLHLTCSQATWTLGLLSVLAGFLGLKDAAMASAPPVDITAPKG